MKTRIRATGAGAPATSVALVALSVLGCASASPVGNVGTGGAGGAAMGGRNGRDGGGGTTGGGGTSVGTGGTNVGSGGRSGATGGASTGSGGGPSASGGAAGSGGRANGTGGAGGTGVGGAAGAADGACKRGVAANTPPGAAFSPAVTWWYDWGNQPSAGTRGPSVEFVPMIWGGNDVGAAIPSASKFLLTFNEPNFHMQSNLTAAQAAGYWPMLQAQAAAIPIVSPGMNFCGPAASCNGTDPYQYLKDFFAACAGCRVDYVAVHWYNCDLPSLRDYLEPGGSLEGFEQFGKPIWLTEFSCDPSASAAAQETFMRAAIPYLESNPNVFRYAWFSADPIPNAKLVNTDGSPTALGQVYIGLPQTCQP